MWGKSLMCLMVLYLGKDYRVPEIEYHIEYHILFPQIEYQK